MRNQAKVVDGDKHLDYHIVASVSTPEPAAVLLFGSGLMGLCRVKERISSF